MKTLHQAKVLLIGKIKTKPVYENEKTTYVIEVLCNKKSSLFTIETSGIEAKKQKEYMKKGAVIFVRGQLVTEKDTVKVIAEDTNLLTWSTKY